MKVFRLPDLGEGLQEAEIVAWHVGVGDHVVSDQPLVSVETDKAVVEVPSPTSGRVAKLYGKPGDIIAVGAELVAFGDAPEADTGGIVGDLSGNGGAERPGEAPAEPETTAGPQRVKATPAVRALAQRLGVDLRLVSPTGPGESITADDVERAAKELDEAGPLEPLRGVRRAMARRMTMAHSEVVPATVSDEADVEAWTAEADTTVRLIRAIAAACAAEPALNAWYDSAHDGRRLHRRVDVGIAVDTEDGLFVPVMRDVANRDANDLRGGLDRMRADIQARTIPPEELRGATITLSNFGMIAGRFAAPVVVPPQVAIVSAGRIAPRFLPENGRPAAHRMLPLSLTFDHRVVTGGEAARFLAAMIADLQRPE